MAASSRRERITRSTATRVWIAAPIMWRKMKSILSPRRPRDVAKQAKSWGLGSHRRMQGSLLPFHVVASILSWLPVKSLLRFRRVCKEWRSLIYNPNFIKENHTRARALGRLALISTRNPAPKVLLYDFGDNGEVRNQAFNLRFGDLNGYNTLTNPVNGLVCIRYCHQGRYGEGIHYLLNPFTRELAKLPASGNGQCGKRTRLGLGFDGSTGGYKLVELFYSEGCYDRCGCRVLEVGTQEWREVRGAPRRMPISEPVHLNGAVHWISARRHTDEYFERRIETFNLKDEKFQSIPVPPECRAQIGPENLVEWEGLLCIVKVHSVFLPGASWTSNSLVRIWRMEDYATCRWREAHCSMLPKCISMDDQLHVVGIRGHEMLLMLHRVGGSGSIGSDDQHTGGSGLIWSYDLRTRSIREHYNYNGEDPGALHILTESMVSPIYLAGNMSLH